MVRLTRRLLLRANHIELLTLTLFTSLGVKARASGGSTAFHLLPFVATEVRRLEGNTGMGFRLGAGSQRSGGCEIASRNKDPAPVAPPVLPCTPKPPARPAGKSNCLGNPLGQAGERLGPSGALFARARCLFWPCLWFAHILHAGWRAGHHGVNFRNSDLVEVRVQS